MKNRRHVAARDDMGQATNHLLNGVPDECPRCHTKVSPSPLGAVRFRDDDEWKIEEGYQCTSHECGKMFIGVYRAGGVAGETVGEFYFTRSIPLDPRPPLVSELVAEVSPTFVETYGQAI